MVGKCHGLRTQVETILCQYYGRSKSKQELRSKCNKTFCNDRIENPRKSVDRILELLGANDGHNYSVRAIAKDHRICGLYRGKEGDYKLLEVG